MNDFQFICPYSPLSGEVNFKFPDNECSSDSVVLDSLSFSDEELSVYLLNEILLPFDFYSGSTSEVTWNDLLTLDISVGESNEISISDTFEFDFYSGEESFALISDTFEFDFFDGNSTVFLVSLFRPDDFQFICPYIPLSGEINFKFPDNECSSFYESVTGSSSEIDLSIFSVLNFEIIEGTIYQIDFILSGIDNIELSPLIDSGEFLELDLNTEKTEVFNFEFRNGCESTVNLYNVSKGGRGLEIIDVIDITDSRRKIKFTLTINDKEIKTEFHIDSINLSRANVSVKNVKFKKQSISVICEMIKRSIQPISVKIYGYK